MVCVNIMLIISRYVSNLQCSQITYHIPMWFIFDHNDLPVMIC